MTKAFLGCIADDFTGATDLANNLVKIGLRVIQTIGLPRDEFLEDVDAVVIALKTRTTSVDVAVSQSLEALHWLKSHGATQFYFKYCSTFDSTPKGNIGPVTDALMDALETDFTIACPAFPENGRTVFKGYLFVGDVLLQESGMRNHPLTPMTDSNLVRVLQAQTNRNVGLVDHKVVSEGPQSILRKFQSLREDGISIAIVDAVSDVNLVSMGPALSGMPLITGGSGVAIGLTHWSSRSSAKDAAKLPPIDGYRAIVSGSCSVATNAQVADFIAKGGAALPINPLQLANGEEVVQNALAWSAGRLKTGPVLIYATADPDAVKATQAQLGIEKAGTLVENALSAIASGLVQQGVHQLIVAGGETSGACVQALDINRMNIGPQIAPGVPWCFAKTHRSKTGGVHITLKSGNFGSKDFFTSAFDILE